MIFGKSTEEKQKIRSRKIENILSFGFKKFAWKPVKLVNGRYIFLQQYYAYLPGCDDNRHDMWVHELSNACLWLVSYNYLTDNYLPEDALIVKLKK